MPRRSTQSIPAPPGLQSSGKQLTRDAMRLVQNIKPSLISTSTFSKGLLPSHVTNEGLLQVPPVLSCWFSLWNVCCEESGEQSHIFGRTASLLCPTTGLGRKEIATDGNRTSQSFPVRTAAHSLCCFKRLESFVGRDHLEEAGVVTIVVLGVWEMGCKTCDSGDSRS